jgi:long-subunit acyl-CoA synthetase (AMP-forming)
MSKLSKSSIWLETCDYYNLNYPYQTIKDENSDNNLVSTDIIRHDMCMNSTIQSDESNNTVLKLLETGVAEYPFSPIIYYYHNFFGNETVPEDLIQYYSYSYSEISKLASSLSNSIILKGFYTKTVHQEKKLNFVAFEASQTLPCIITFFSAYFNDMTNLPIDENLTGDQILAIMNHAEVESLFCSKITLMKIYDCLDLYLNQESNNDLQVNTNKNWNNISFLKSVIFYDDSVVDSYLLEFLDKNNIKFYYFWESIYCSENNIQQTKIFHRNHAQSSSPAILSYHFENKDTFSAVIITHKSLISKVLGFNLFFHKAFRENFDKFIIDKNISNLDCLCILLLSVNLNDSTILLKDINHLFCSKIKNQIEPTIFYTEHETFQYLYQKIDDSFFNFTQDNVEKIEKGIHYKELEKVTGKLLGKSLKLIIIKNQNKIPIIQISKFKSFAPFSVSIAQGYLPETIGSILFSYNNKFVSGQFGLILPCFEGKIVKEYKNSRDTLNDAYLDSQIATYSGNLFLRGEAFFHSYFKNYVKNNDIKLNYDNQLWLNTQYKSLLTKNLSIKILERYQDILFTTKIPFIYVGLLKSVLKDKHSMKYFEEVQIIPDEKNYELDLIVNTTEVKFIGFIKYLTLLNKGNIEFIVSCDFEKKLKDEINDGCVLYKKNDDCKNSNNKKNMLQLQFCVKEFFSQILDKTFLLSFEDINSIKLNIT